jgi:hypothetical protein
MRVNDPGLCATCVHAQVVRGARSVFWMCGLAATDPRFARYPRLPVLHCDGYAQRQEDDAAPDDDEPGATTPTDPAAPPP